MPIDVYLAPASSPCRAVLMTAKIIGIEVNKIYVKLSDLEHLKPEYIKINPQHTVPTINDNGFFLYESRAILTYLANKYAPESSLYPKCPKARAIVDRMLFFDIGTLFKAESEYLFPQLFQGKPADPEKNEAFKKALAFLEDFLSITPYVAGDSLTLADLSIVANITFASLQDYDLSEFPKITTWLEKMKKEIPEYKEINEDTIKVFRTRFPIK